MRSLLESDDITIRSCLSESQERVLADDVLDGLTRPFKELPPKHFYDARGSELFEQICQLPEYYPTRSEREILETHADDIARRTGAVELVELGSGSAEKARILLSAMSEAGQLKRYIPLDVSEQALNQAAHELVDEYDELRVEGVVGDFERHLASLPPVEDGVGRIVALLGGTIGNFPPGSRRRFLRSIASVLGGTIGNFPPGTRRRLLREIRGLMRDGDRLLLGTDLVKDPDVIEAAYDDSEGVTAEFNRNVLRVINRELGADFSPERFEHVAFFDRRHEWIEMRLRALGQQSVSIERVGLRVEFEDGEELRTEISAKFTRRRLQEDLGAAGLRLDGWYTDSQELFALSLAAVADAGTPSPASAG